MIRNLIFDISGVFITSDEEEILKMYSERLDVPFSEIEGAYGIYYEEYESGKLSQKEFTKLVFDKIGKDVPSDFWTKRLKLKKRYADMFEFLDLVKKRYNCYFISNEGKEYWEEVDKKLRISENFIDGVVSFEAGVRKPDIRIFEMLLERDNLVPEECVFIDDSVDNLEGAGEAGMKALHFIDRQQIMRELKRIGVGV